jgi:hypothetical protein
MANKWALRATAEAEEMLTDVFMAWSLDTFRARSAILRSAHAAQAAGGALNDRQQEINLQEPAVEDDAGRRSEELTLQHASHYATGTTRSITAPAVPSKAAAAAAAAAAVAATESESELAVSELPVEEEALGLGDVVLPEGVHWNSNSRWIVLFASRDAKSQPGEGDPYYYRPSRPPRTLSSSASASGLHGGEHVADGDGDDDSETEWDPPPEGVSGLGHGGHVWMFDTHI